MFILAYSLLACAPEPAQYEYGIALADVEFVLIFWSMMDGCLIDNYTTSIFYHDYIVDSTLWKTL